MKRERADLVIRRVSRRRCGKHMDLALQRPRRLRLRTAACREATAWSLEQGSLILGLFAEPLAQVLLVFLKKEI